MEDKNGLVRVPLGACTCPNTPHDEDYVKLLPRLGMARSLAVIRASAVNDIALTEMALGVGYARFGIAAWNLTDEAGKPIPVEGDSLEQFSEHDPRTIMVALKGDELYGSEVVAPLVAMAKSSSPPTSTNGQTSATNGTNSSTKSRKPSKRSSTTTIPTEDTETISVSPAGGSSS